ncbi:MAG TPA: hypothetical protein VNJ50_12030 [Gelidibacter sp.]|uniref:hypothetical protein n=1 Tax=Gelidibacter sp. TaxID=2018083 RepID=UPI002D1B78F1|nr:hypothetical protein [Gelidibacter sp.]HXJ99570.1 hypothetical protein [Gelidibacter sp.]
MILLSLNIVMLAVVLCIVVPFLLFIWVDKSTKQKKRRKFLDIAHQQSLKLSVVEYWNNSFIGYDENENILIYMNSSGPEMKFQKIDLDDVRKCTINKTTTEYKNGDRYYTEMSRLDLDITFVSNTAPERITLFTIDDVFSENQEMQRAEKWLAFIDKHKYNKQNVVSA